MQKSTDNYLLDSVRLPLYLVLLMGAVHLLNILSFHNLGYWGIYPRVWAGVRGIFTAPFIHGTWSHLASNAVPFLVTGTMIMYFYRSIAIQAMLMMYLLTGAAVWLFGRSVFHIGASGVVYAFVAFIFWSGIFRRNLKSVMLAAIITLLYSGMFFGILPNQEGISWESHLLGGLVGIFTAYIFKEQIEPDEAPEERAIDTTPKRSYFAPDTFDMTREERRLWEEEQRRLYEEEQRRRWEAEQAARARFERPDEYV